MANNFSFQLADLNRELEGEFPPGQELDESDFEQIKLGDLRRPSFPATTFLCAAIKDSIDIASLGWLGTLTNGAMWIIIKKYLWGKTNFIKRRLYRRYIFTVILEFVPWINTFPQNTFFVLRSYATEKKEIDRVLTAVEKLILRSR
jgi:hypothetical protein